MRAARRRRYRKRHGERVLSLKMRNSQMIQCWCGAVGTYHELFSDDFSLGCGGSGQLDCYCGGDFCVCHNHGAADCPGCDDCEGAPDDYDDYDDDWDDYLDDY